MEGGDWRTELLLPGTRQRIVDKLSETLKRRLHYPEREGLHVLHKLKNIVVRFEERIYTEANSQQDYIRKISFTMRRIHSKFQNPVATSLQSNVACNSRNPQDQGEENIFAPGQAQIQGQVMGGEVVTNIGLKGDDWRIEELPLDIRRRIVDKVTEALRLRLKTLKRPLPFSGPVGIHELKKMAVGFEGKIYTAATSQQDYLRKIPWKSLKIGSKSRNPVANSLQSNGASNSRNPQDPGELDTRFVKDVKNDFQDVSMPRITGPE